MSKIKKLEIAGLWDKYDVAWSNINPDVNILLGINGGGKSTVLRLIRDCIDIHSKSVLKNYFINGCRVSFDDGTSFSCGGTFGENTGATTAQVEYINIFELNLGKFKPSRNQSILDYQLEVLLYQRDPSVNNLTNYRLRATVGDNLEEIVTRIKKLFALFDSLFARTGKHIELAENNTVLQFRDCNGNVIPLKNLSAGEKQLMIILLRVFLTDEKSCVILFDEPEISLHIDWQARFIDIVRELNPNAQLFISTHSPGIFGDGWNDKLIFIDDLTTDL